MDFFSEPTYACVYVRFVLVPAQAYRSHVTCVDHNRCVSTIFTKIVRFDVTATIRVHGDVDMYILSRVKVVIMKLPVRFYQLRPMRRALVPFL